MIIAKREMLKDFLMKSPLKLNEKSRNFSLLTHRCSLHVDITERGIKRNLDMAMSVIFLVWAGFAVVT